MTDEQPEAEALADERIERTAHLTKYFNRVASLLRDVDVARVAAVAELLRDTLDTGAQVFFIGNGGSAATATHYVNDLVMAAARAGRSIRVVSLSDNAAVITGIGNDFSFDEVFELQLRTIGQPGDLVVAISASGNSPNLVTALEYAQSAGMRTAAIVSFDGGTLVSLAQTAVHVPTETGEYGPAEDAHMVINHAIASLLSQLLA